MCAVVKACVNWLFVVHGAFLRAYLREEITGKNPSDCENKGKQEKKNKRAYNGIICKTVSRKSQHLRTPQKIVLFLLKPKSRCPKTADKGKIRR